MAHERITGVIADAHVLERLGLLSVLARIFGTRKVQAVSDFETLTHSVDGTTRLVLVDSHLPGLRDLAMLSAMQQNFATLKLVYLAADKTVDAVVEALRHGLDGVVFKTMEPERLATAFRMILDGFIYVPNEVRDLALSGNAVENDLSGTGTAPPGGLSTRQRQVLELACSGYSNKEIGRHLSISDSTVKVHISAAFRALGVHTRSQAMTVLGRGRRALAMPLGADVAALGSVRDGLTPASPESTCC